MMEYEDKREAFAEATREILKGCQALQRRDGVPALSDERIEELVKEVTDGKFGPKKA